MAEALRTTSTEALGSLRSGLTNVLASVGLGGTPEAEEGAMPEEILPAAGAEPEPEPEPELEPEALDSEPEPDPDAEELLSQPAVSFVVDAEGRLAGLKLDAEGHVVSFDRSELASQLSSVGSPTSLDAAGLGVGSAVVTVDGRKVKSAKALKKRLRKVPEGNTVSLQFTPPSGAARRLLRRHSRDGGHPEAVEKRLKVRLDLIKETWVVVELKENMSDLKRKIAAAAVARGVKGASKLAEVNLACCVVAVVDGVQTVLPDELTVRDALLYAERSNNPKNQPVRFLEPAKDRQEVDYLYLVKYHVPASWKIVGAVRYAMAAVWLGLGIMLLVVALVEDPHACSSREELRSGPEACAPNEFANHNRTRNETEIECWYCKDWFEPETNVTMRERILDDAEEHCRELQSLSYGACLQRPFALGFGDHKLARDVSSHRGSVHRDGASPRWARPSSLVFAVPFALSAPVVQRRYGSCAIARSCGPSKSAGNVGGCGTRR